MNCTCVVDWLRITKRRHIQLITDKLYLKSAEWKNNSFFIKNIKKKLKNSPFS